MRVPIYNNSSNKNPEYTCPTDAGCDLRANFSRVSPESPLKIYGDGGIIFAGEGHPLTMLRLEPGARANTPGTIDTGYRNEWFVPVINLGFETVWIEDGERIAQAVLNKLEKIEWVNSSLEDITSAGTDRGGGIGHSGSK